MTGAPAGRIDVHAHYVPDGYRAAAVAAGHERPDGFPALPAWDAAGHVAVMDRMGIATSLLSLSSPGVHFGDDEPARSLARSVNEAGRRAVVDHPGRFGLFATLPMPDVEGALAEIDHALDTLDADGVVLLTNAGGTYLGDARFEPVFAELDRRGARVFLHPTSPPCWEHTALGRPRPLLEFLFDTTRTVIDLVLSGVTTRHPAIAWIVPHGGAALPVLADRVAAFSLVLADVDRGVDVLRELSRLHFDLAGFPLPRQLDALLALTVIEHLHYGSDVPFTPEVAAGATAAALDAVEHVGRRRTGAGSDGTPDGGRLTDLLRANTLRLFPDLDRHGARR